MDDFNQVNIHFLAETGLSSYVGVAAISISAFQFQNIPMNTELLEFLVMFGLVLVPEFTQNMHMWKSAENKSFVGGISLSFFLVNVVTLAGFMCI